MITWLSHIEKSKKIWKTKTKIITKTTAKVKVKVKVKMILAG